MKKKYAPTDIHRYLKNVYGDQTMYVIIVSLQFVSVMATVVGATIHIPGGSTPILAHEICNLENYSHS